MEIELIGVPFDGYGRPGHQSQAPSALREASLVVALAPHTVHDTGDLSLPEGENTRGPQTGLLNEPALLAMTEQLHERVPAVLAAERFPVMVGADCSLLLGVVTALHEAIDQPGLLFLDGHEDTMPLDVVEDGEAANCEIALLLGITGRLLTGPLATHLPALVFDNLAMLGQHDADWRRKFNAGSLADIGVWSRNLDQMRHDPHKAAKAATAHLRTNAQQWWLHLDLDVLDPTVFQAQGLPEHADDPDGLNLNQLTTAANTGGCIGLSVTIYDPQQDPDHSDANTIVNLTRKTIQAKA
ncbi:arginase family protein [Phytoactinopolyspora limicola]|uniref:arginase family protein n=1 Tax=Phytoactinopolyspora limicola TaxID=2715536 RepID=UPI00140E7E07|nr:arginase family protein [Phytoactinopolyspora limicola]